jgi:hypothetical protein
MVYSNAARYMWTACRLLMLLSAKCRSRLLILVYCGFTRLSTAACYRRLQRALKALQWTRLQLAEQ